MNEGTVKWFNNNTGLGFIVPCEGGADVFAHYSVINVEGYRRLVAGEKVKYEFELGPKGVIATAIWPVNQEGIKLTKPYSLKATSKGAS